MAEIINKISLQDGTLVRHKVIGYQGTIEGKTEIKTCFTRGEACWQSRQPKKPSNTAW